MMMNWQTGRLNVWLRFTALTVAFLFTWNTVLWADGTGNIAATLRAGHAAQPDALLAAPLDSIRLPQDFGQIKRAYRGTRPGLIVHIQDAHVNEEAQRRIADIVDLFASGHKARLIGLEGAAGELAHRVLSVYPNQKARQAVADYFLGEGKLTGAEYLAISKRPELVLFGAEEKALYGRNRGAFLAALDFKPRDEKTLEALRTLLEQAARHVFSKELWEFFQQRKAFLHHTQDLAAYLQYLTGAHRANYPEDPSLSKNYPHLEAFLKLLQAEKEIDLEAAEAEIPNLVRALKENLTGPALRNFRQAGEMGRARHG